MIVLGAGIAIGLGAAELPDNNHLDTVFLPDQRKGSGTELVAELPKTEGDMPFVFKKVDASDSHADLKIAQANFESHISDSMGREIQSPSKDLKFCGNIACVIDSTDAHLAMRLYEYDSTTQYWAEKGRIVSAEGAWDLFDVYELKIVEGLAQVSLASVKFNGTAGAENTVGLMTYDTSMIDGVSVVLRNGTAEEMSAAVNAYVVQDDFEAGVTRADTTNFDIEDVPRPRLKHGDVMPIVSLNQNTGGFPVPEERPYQVGEEDPLQLPAIIPGIR